MQPSQLYISEGKLRLASEWFDAHNLAKMDPIPVKLFQDRYLMTDGHTRALLAYLSGKDQIPCYLDTDDLDMRAYALDVVWCDEEGVRSVADLATRVVSIQQYEELWRRRCMEMND